jgi:hypothetical protein
MAGHSDARKAVRDAMNKSREFVDSNDEEVKRRQSQFLPVSIMCLVDS